MMRTLVTLCVRNPMVVNLIMVIVLVAGTFVAITTRREVFPNMSFDIITVAVPFPGASAGEVEEGVTILIEEAVEGIGDIDYIESVSSENLSTVVIFLRTDVEDPDKTLDDVKDTIDQIRNFPDDIEEPIITIMDNEEDVIRVALFSDKTVADELSLKEIAEEVRDELLDLPEISSVDTYGVREREIVIEIPEKNLQKYGISFEEIELAVRSSNLDVSGGTIKTDVEEMTLRAAGKRYRPVEFSRIPLRTFPDGTRVLLGDVADVREDFVDINYGMFMNHKPGVMLKVMKSKTEDSIKIAEAVRNYVDRKKHTMPPGVAMDTMVDLSRLLNARIKLLLKNALYAFVLIFIILMIFLGYRLSFWVAMGLPVTMLGTILVVRIPDVTISMMSLFAFITVIGLLVDDAIVVSENVQQHIEKGEDPETAAIEGTLEVYTAVMASVTTTVLAFSPFFLVVGMWGKFLAPIPWVSAVGLIISLLECLFILPCHLAHSLHSHEEDMRRRNAVKRIRVALDNGIQSLIEYTYKPALNVAMRFRWHTFILGFAFFIITLGVIASGKIKFVFMPEMDSDWVVVEYTLEPGSSMAVQNRVMDHIDKTVVTLNEEMTEKRNELLDSRVGRGYGEMFPEDTPVIDNILSVQGGLGSNEGFKNQETVNPDVGMVLLEMIDGEDRGIAAVDVVNRWRELIGEVPGVLKMNYRIPAGPTGVSVVEVLLSGDNMDELMEASRRVQSRMREYPGVYDIQDDLSLGRREINLKLNDRGEALGLTLADLIKKVRFGFYGHELHTIQRGRDEIKIWARYPKNERTSIEDFESIKIPTRFDAEVPLTEVAEIETSRQLRSIKRHERERTLRASCKLDIDVITPDELKDELRKHMPGLLDGLYGVSYSLEGQDRDQRLLMESLQFWFQVALFAIFVVIALAFKNYLHSIMIMIIVPLGMVGMVAGHFVVPVINTRIDKLDLTMLSMAGLVALGGIVVNDSIVMIDSIKRNIGNGQDLMPAVHDGAVSRFRPIVLTTLTTSIGMMPLILEKSLQAQFLIPMAASIAFGLIVGTFFTQLWLPAAFIVFNDMKRVWYFMAKGIHYKPVVIERNALADGNFIKGVVPWWIWLTLVLCAGAVFVTLRYFPDVSLL